jgi:hypothetical protein
MYAVPNMAVFSSSSVCFLGLLLGDILNDFEMVRVAPFVIGVSFVFTFHMRYVCVCVCVFVRYLYLKNHFGVFLDHISVS